MQSRWNDEEAVSFDGPIGACVYCTRLIGSDPSLVLHGGGNSSVKAPYVDVTGRRVDAIYVKGSGWDMGTIATAGFAPLPIDRLRNLLDLESLSDLDMARELDAARLDPSASDTAGARGADPLVASRSEERRRRRIRSMRATARTSSERRRRLWRGAVRQPRTTPTDRMPAGRCSDFPRAP